MRKPPLKRFPSLYKGRKPVLSSDELSLLFSKPFIIEEKLDGTLTVKKHEDLYLMLEDMKYKHTVFYNKLPGRYILVDVCLEDGSRLSRVSREVIGEELGYALPAMTMSATALTGDISGFLGLETGLHNGSAYGDVPREGFVIKSEVYRKIGGKYSRLDLTGVPRYTKNELNHIVGRMN
jgi:hypothetical protein